MAKALKKLRRKLKISASDWLAIFGAIPEIVMMWPAVRARLKELAATDPVLTPFVDRLEEIHRRATT